MKVLRSCLLTLLLAMLVAPQVKAWGFWAHMRINRLAVYTLPPQMLKLYKNNIEYVTEHAVDPDKRRYAMDGEAPRHYIDIDHYGHYPFENVPRKWDDAVAKFTEDTLNAYGIVPWHIYRSYHWLVEAFHEGNLQKIMKLSADMGHYIGDANVPLHTTENYNGQLTGQKGIHGLWESRLPELFGEDYNYFIGRAKYLPDVLDEMWSAVLESHSALDSVLNFESGLTTSMDSDRKYSFENRGTYLTKAYSKEFCTAYHDQLAGQVERRMRASIVRVGSIWYSAWVDAGQPDLTPLLNKSLEPSKKEFRKLFKIIDRESGEIGMYDLMKKVGPLELAYGSCCGHSMRTCHKATGQYRDDHDHDHDGEHKEEYVQNWNVTCVGVIVIDNEPVSSGHLD